MKTIVFIFVLMFGGPRLVWGVVAPDVLIYQGGLKRVAMSNLWGFLPSDLVVDGQVGVTLSGVFLGSGAGLTNISGTGVTGLGTAAFSNASAFASSSVTNLTAGQLLTLAAALTNASAFAPSTVTNLTAGQLASLASALTNATAFDTNGAATDVKSVILSSNYVTAAITNGLGSAAFSSASAFASSSVTNLTAGQLAILAAALTNASAFAPSSVTNLTAGQLVTLASALTNAGAFDSNGAATVIKSAILSSNYVTASITNGLGSAAYSSASAFASSSVTNLTAGQLATIAVALTNAGAFASSGVTNLTAGQLATIAVAATNGANIAYSQLPYAPGITNANGGNLTNIPLAGLQVVPLTNNPSALPWTNSVGIYGNAVGLTNYRAIDLNNYGASPGFVLTAVDFTSLAWSNLPPVQSTNIVTSAGTLAVASLATNYTVPLLPGEIVSTLVIRLANTNAYLTFTGTNVFDASRKVMFNGFTNTVNSSIKLNLPRYRTNSVLNLIVTNGSSLFLEFWAPDTTGTNIIVTQTGLFK